MQGVPIAKDGFGVDYHNRGNNPNPFLHHHDYYEIIYYLGQREMQYLHEGTYHTVSRGDIILCGIFENHQCCYEREENHVRVSMGISPSFLLKYTCADSNLFNIFDARQEHYPIFSPTLEQAGKYVNLFSHYMSLEKRKNEPGVLSLQRACTHTILANLYYDCCLNLAQLRSSRVHVELVSRIVSYTDEHIKEWITVAQLADYTGYSAGYLSKIFKKVTGTSLNQYLLWKRLDWAKFLIEGGHTITEASEQAGFDNYSYFYKAFKKQQGVSPKEYKEQLKNKNE